jgi:signal peptidase I
MSSLAQQKAAYLQKTERLRGRLARFVRIGFIAAVVALFLRGFIYEPYSLPSQSMQPGLQPGETLFVAKWPYGFSRHNLPLSPALLPGRLLPRLPARGDLIVFKTPRDGNTDFVKRVIALPGDTVAMRQGRPILNGQPLPRQSAGQTSTHQRFIETLPLIGTSAGRTITVQETRPSPAARAAALPTALAAREDFGPITVPQGQLFLLGDNRDASADSRYSPAEGGIGLVPLDLVIGRVDRILYSHTPARIGKRP